MTTWTILRRCILISVFSFAGCISWPGDSSFTGLSYIEVISAEIWIERHNGTRYLGYIIEYRVRGTTKSSFERSKKNPVRSAYYLVFRENNKKIYWDMASPNGKDESKFLFRDATGVVKFDSFKWNEMVFRNINGRDWRKKESAQYIEIVDIDSEKVGLPLQDGRWNVIINSSWTFRPLDNIIIEVRGDDINTQIIKNDWEDAIHLYRKSGR